MTVPHKVIDDGKQHPFAYALTNSRPELISGESVSQSVAHIQMMSHHMSKPCESLPCSSYFHDTPSPPLCFILITLPIYGTDFSI